MTLAVDPIARKAEADDGSREIKRKSKWMGKELAADAANPELDWKITREILGRFHEKFTRMPLNRFVQNALTENSLHEISLNRKAKVDVSHEFSHRINIHPHASNQRSSGRCWLFAGLNCMRIAMMEKYDLPKKFEFSQNYLFFYDQLEKANLFLTRMIEWADRPFEEEELTRELKHPVTDCGYWNYFCNLVNKYGVIPKSAMPETHHSGDTQALTKILSYQLRQFTLELRDVIANNADMDQVIDRKREMMSIIYRILVDFLGDPPVAFDWEYRTRKRKKYNCQKDLTPLEFYEKWVPYTVDDKVLILNRPTALTPYFHRYTQQKDNNMVGGSPTLYLNLPYKKIVPSLIESIKHGEPVFLYADVRKQHNRAAGALDVSSFNYESLFGTPFGMTKTDRIKTRHTRSAHSMVLCGVNLDRGSPNRWCVENSWGKECPKDGYLSMTHEWLQEYTFAYAIDRKYIPRDIKDLTELQPIELFPNETI